MLEKRAFTFRWTFKSNVMKIIYSLVFVALIGGNVFSQQYTPDPAIEAEVNLQVWKPFKVAYEARDWKSFNNLHTDDMLRVNKWGGIKTGIEYKASVEKSYQRKDSRKRTIDLWFEHRIYSDDFGYEVGYYRVIYDEPGKDQLITHARFHVVLKKINGVWKIAQDWDTNMINGVSITAADFAKGTPVRF